jgi:MraZ protein
MFIGQFNHTLDDKSRITLPAKFRAQLESGIVMTAGTEKHILVYPQSEFDALASRVSELPQFGPEAATLRRLVFVNAADAIPDRQGRVILPDLLKAHSQIDGEAVVVGVGKFIEIWSPELWQQARAQVQDAK